MLYFHNLGHCCCQGHPPSLSGVVHHSPLTPSFLGHLLCAWEAAVSTQMCPGPRVQAQVTNQGPWSKTGSDSNNCSEGPRPGRGERTSPAQRETHLSLAVRGRGVGTELAERPGWREDQMQSRGQWLVGRAERDHPELEESQRLPGPDHGGALGPQKDKDQWGAMEIWV